MYRIITIIFYLIICNAPVYAQGWEWGKGSIGNTIESWPVATDHTGNVYVAGVSSGAVSFDSYDLVFAVGSHPCVVAKYDWNGNFLWSRSTGNSINTYPVNITTDASGNCYLLGWLSGKEVTLGSYTLHNAAYPDAQYFIVKFDPMGNITWATCAGGMTGQLKAPPVSLSSVYTANVLGTGGIVTDATGNIYVTTGFNLPEVTVGPAMLTNKDASGATNDILLVKYDPSGNVLWAKSSGGAGDDIPCAITITPAGSIYITGVFNSDSANFGPSVVRNTNPAPRPWNAFIARYDAAGEPVWAAGSGGTGNTYAAGLTSDTSSNVYITGGTAENALSFNGTSVTNPYPGNPVLYLLKFTSSNNVGWSKTIGSPSGGIASGYSVAFSANNRVWVCGAFSNEVSIDGHIVQRPQSSIDPVFIAGYNTDGSYVAADALQSGSAHQSGIACDTQGNVYLCSDYQYPCYPFIIANYVLPTVTAGESWQYLAKYTFTISGSGGPVTVNTRADTSLCLNEGTAKLTAPDGYTLYQWSDGSSDSILTISSAGTYWVKALGTNNHAEIKTITVTADSGLCNCNAVLPNAFTPNSDGRNDTYGPIFGKGCVITKYAFSIYNRWGQRVFYTEDPWERWNGTFNNIPADMDVYMFYLIYSPNPQYPEHVKKGDLTLVR